MMHFVLERVSEPEIEPILLDEMKRHLRGFDDITSEDTDIEGLITVAREWVEDYTGRALIDQTWRMTVTGYESGAIPLRRSPVLSLESFTSVGADGVETSLEDPGSPTINTFQIAEPDSKWPRLVPLTGASWTAGTLRIVFRAGFADRSISPQEGGEAVPRTVRQAIKMIAAHYYDLRAPVVVGTIASELPLGVKWLLASQRCNNQLA